MTDAIRVRSVAGSPIAVIVLVTWAAFAPPALAQSAGDHAARIDISYPHPQPPYPDTAQINGEQGAVTLNVKVGDNGRVRGVRINQSSGFDDLDNAAIEGVLRWRFLPAVRDGDTTTEWTKIRIVFQLPAATGSPAQAPPAIPKS